MDDSCVFCRILAGQQPESRVCEDEHTVAFMDVQPINPGHTLIIPRHHVASVRELEADAASALWQTGLRVARALSAAGVRMEGLNLFLADGQSAGQEVFHTHLHVLPRFAGDGFGLRIGPGNHLRTTRAELDTVAAHIRAALS